MRLYLIAVVIAIALLPALARGEEILPGAKLDETSRDSPYINDATTAGDRAAERAMQERTGTGRIELKHYFILRNVHGVVRKTDVYVIPNTDDPNRPPLY